MIFENELLESPYVVLCFLFVEDETERFSVTLAHAVRSHIVYNEALSYKDSCLQVYLLLLFLQESALSKYITGASSILNESFSVTFLCKALHPVRYMLGRNAVWLDVMSC